MNLNWGWLIFILVGIVVVIASGGDDESSSDHPYIHELGRDAPPVINVGDFGRCRKQVGTWVFQTRDKPFTARYRAAVDEACQGAQPTDQVNVVGDYAIELAK